MKINPEAELAVKLTMVKLGSTGRWMPLPHKNAMQIAFDAGKLKSLARAHNRLMETQCNRELTVREMSRVGSVRDAIIAILAEYSLSLKVNFSGDPRGYTVKIHFPDGRGNTWGGDSEGWGI